MHAWFPACYDHCVNVFFAAFQHFQGDGFLQKRRLRIYSYAPVVAERAAQVAAWRKEHAGYSIGIINEADFL